MACSHNVDGCRVRTHDCHTPEDGEVVVVLVVLDNLPELALGIGVDFLRISIGENQSSGDALCCAVCRS